MMMPNSLLILKNMKRYSTFTAKNRPLSSAYLVEGWECWIEDHYWEEGLQNQASHSLLGGRGAEGSRDRQVKVQNQHSLEILGRGWRQCVCRTNSIDFISSPSSAPSVSAESAILIAENDPIANVDLRVGQIVNVCQDSSLPSCRLGSILMPTSSSVKRSIWERVSPVRLPPDWCSSTSPRRLLYELDSLSLMDVGKESGDCRQPEGEGSRMFIPIPFYAFLEGLPFPRHGPLCLQWRSHGCWGMTNTVPNDVFRLWSLLSLLLLVLVSFQSSILSPRNARKSTSIRRRTLGNWLPLYLIVRTRDPP